MDDVIAEVEARMARRMEEDCVLLPEVEVLSEGEMLRLRENDPAGFEKYYRDLMRVARVDSSRQFEALLATSVRWKEAMDLLAEY